VTKSTSSAAKNKRKSKTSSTNKSKRNSIAEAKQVKRLCLDREIKSTDVEVLVANLPSAFRAEVSELRRSSKGLTLRVVSATNIISAGDVYTSEGPYLIVVNGNVSCRDAVFSTREFIPGLVIIQGNLRVRSVKFCNGARVFVTGSIEVSECIIGEDGDKNAVMQADKTVTARAVLLRSSAVVYASKGLVAVVCAAGGTYRFRSDIPNEGSGTGGEYFVPTVLDRYDDLDFGLAYQAICKGNEIFKPDVLEKFVVKARKT
jgi:hypothetical protein